MTREQAHTRNWKIAQLRGVLPRLASGRLIPKDISDELSREEYVAFIDTAHKIIDIMDEVKVKRFTCNGCNDVTGLHVTRNVKALMCDYCRSPWTSELYSVRSNDG